MAAFPTCMKKPQPIAIMSPRQTANKAYTLTIKKLDRDEKRPHYSIREKLLLSNTLAKAEQMLNKPTCVRTSWPKEEEDVLAPLPHYAPPSEKVQQWIPEHMVLSIAVMAAAFQPSCRPIYATFSIQ
ncbi:hypothetical protein EDC96DRAFT_114263 [Choanephora cucurbitarum]|nr:hypothetical protein EDC96DRAFT_114263 [Choanephora cucurbitarum]